MTLHPVERLSDYVDGDLSVAERESIDRHLAECESCANTLAELRGVVARVQALNDRPPAADLWPGIAALIGDQPVVRLRPSERRFSLTVPQLLAAAIALMVLSAGGVAWFLKGRTPSGSPAPVAIQSTPSITPAASGKGYDAAVGELEGILAAHRAQLDSTTVRVLEEKLALIDRAVADAQRALATDPKDPYLNGHLAQTRLQKLELLRRAALLAASAS